MLRKWSFVRVLVCKWKWNARSNALVGWRIKVNHIHYYQCALVLSVHIVSVGECTRMRLSVCECMQSSLSVGVSRPGSAFNFHMTSACDYYLCVVSSVYYMYICEFACMRVWCCANHFTSSLYPYII